MPVDPKPRDPVPVNDLQRARVRRRLASRTRRRRRRRCRDISFRVERGETVAFVGPSGSGKTTLVKLLVGLYQPKQGHVLYNGVDSTPRRSRSLPRAHRSRDAGRAALLRLDSREPALRAPRRDRRGVPRGAAQSRRRTICCDRADKGLDTVIGEGGMKISGGEKQRLSIARALLRRPHLLVFDEATSALDSLTEEEISRTMREISATAQRDHRPHRASAVDRDARRSHSRARARPHRRGGPPRRAARAQGAVLRDVAPAGRRADGRSTGEGRDRWRVA